MKNSSENLTTYKIIILGSGGIGRAVGLLLAEHADFNMQLYLGDHDLEVANNAAAWVDKGNTRSIMAIPFHFYLNYENQNDNLFQDANIILDCLPGSQAVRIGLIAKKYSLHYVNLTEHVEETTKLAQIAANSQSGFILQTGLAPGFINILTTSLYNQFIEKFNNNKVEHISMKVGALTKNAMAPHFYGFTWSPVGVATQYVKDACIINNYKRATAFSLTGQSLTVIDGVNYEECHTSGGAADLPYAFEGLTKHLEYKTLRYPGHFDWVKKILAEAPLDVNPVHFLEQKMLSIIPLIEDDQVIIYASIKGFDKRGYLQTIEKSFKIGPTTVGNITLKAIQSTTAASMAECARMLLLNNSTGLIRQSEINSSQFLNGPFIQLVYYLQKTPVVSSYNKVC